MSLVTLVAVTALTIVYTSLIVILHFSWYDDEGFMLFTLRQFEAGIPLYDAMYTEYGPFYYLAVSSLLRLFTLPATHDVIRVLTIVCWNSIAVASALCVWAWSRSTLWTIATLVSTAVILVPLRGEPGHPQLLIQLFIIAAIATVTLEHSGSKNRGFFVAGALAAAISLMKVNVGIFVLLSLAAYLVIPRSPSRLLSILRVPVISLVLILPGTLMYRHLAQPMAIAQCAVFTFGLLALVCALRRSNHNQSPTGFWAAAGYLLVMLSIIAASLAAGATLEGLLNGVVLQPLRFSRAIPFQRPPLPVLVVGILACAWALTPLLRPTVRSFTSRLRYPAAVGLALIACLNPQTAVWLAPALLWLLVPENIQTTLDAASTFVINTGVFCLLITYPVDGTQVYLSGSLVFLAAMVGVCRWRPHSSSGRRAVESAAAITVISMGVFIGLLHLPVSQTEPKVPSGLPHSSLIRLPAQYAAAFGNITDQVALRCDALVTIPGMNSFHLWSGIPRPSPFTISSTMVLFDTRVQQELREAFDSARRPCVIYHASLESWSARYRIERADQPFRDYVRNDLVPVHAQAGYEIRVPARDSAEWLKDPADSE